MPNYAILDSGGVVVGLAVWDGVAHWPLPAGNTRRLATLADVVAPIPPPVPASVTNFQARAVMRATILPDGRSLETAVRTYLAGQVAAAAALDEADPLREAADTAWLAWEQSNDFERGGLLIASLGAGFGLTPAGIDALFIAAVGISA